MSHFLFRPHVVGPENDITTPDVLVDRANIVTERAQIPLPVHRVQTMNELQTPLRDTVVAPAYALIACGGGTLLGLAAVVQPAGSPASAADCVLSRASWRLRNVASGFDGLTLSIRDDRRSESSSLPPNPEISDDHSLPRGVAVIYVVRGASLTVAAPSRVIAEIVDPARERRLALAIKLTPVADDRWDDERPLPRYTVGPVGDVKHYI